MNFNDILLAATAKLLNDPDIKEVVSLLEGSNGYSIQEWPAVLRKLADKLDELEEKRVK